MVDAKYSADPKVCLALNRNYKRFISEHVKNISLVLEHNRQRQVCAMSFASFLSTLYGRVLRKDASEWVKKSMAFVVEGVRPRGDQREHGRKLWRRYEEFEVK